MTRFSNPLFGIAFASVLLVSACSDPGEPAPTSEAEASAFMMAGTAVTAELQDLGDGQWAVELQFDEPKTAMFFSRSLGDYRTQTWTPQRGSPAIERINGLDAMMFDTPTTSASYLITPYTDDIIGDYTPWLGFSDGSLALYTGQFELLDGVDRDSIEALRGDLTAWTGEQGELGVRIRTDKTMLFDGAIQQSPLQTRTRGQGDYVMIGDTPLEEGTSFVGVIDDALPAQISDSLDDDLAAIFSNYENAFGSKPQEKATLYFAFGGFDHPGFSFSGSVIGSDLIVMRVSGAALKDYPPAIRQHILWFFAHEGAHIFQSLNGTMPSGAGAGASWIHEGSANTMAVQSLLMLNAADDAYRLADLKRAADTCADGLVEGPLNTLAGQIHYDCGDVIFNMAAATLPDMSVFDVWKAIAEEARQTGAEDINAPLVFSVFDNLGVHEDVLIRIKEMVFQDLENPHLVIANGLRSAGLELAEGANTE